jgi:hypothetical protein
LRRRDKHKYQQPAYSQIERIAYLLLLIRSALTLKEILKAGIGIDLTADPAKPAWIGQERLAEAYSGIPGRVAISGNYAYVSTVMAGLQVVDIDKSRKYSGANPGESIVGSFDTVGQGFNQPLDIIVYKGGRAALTTTSGNLLVLDVNMPQYPQLITAYKPAGYTAWHADVAAEYTYTDEAGNSQVMDVAVTYGLNGKIYTVDLTDPYNIHNYGPVKNADGTDLLVFASDIKISKASGLAYLSTGNGVYVIDIKNPKDPKLLNFIMQTPTAPGSTTTSPLGSSTALVEKDGWVYLANPQKGLKVLDLDPIYLTLYCEEGEFVDAQGKPTVHIPCDHFYPALAKGGKGKTVMLLGYDANFHLANGQARVKLVRKEPDTVIVTADAFALPNCPNQGSLPCTGFKDGVAMFYVSVPNDFTGNVITLDFQSEIAPTGGTLQSSTLDINQRRVTLNVKNNSNVSLDQVLKGEAVFVYDDTSDVNRLGAYRDQTQDAKDENKRFYFVQELLNQVVPRKRNLDDPFNPGHAYSYMLINEDGNFGSDTYNQLVAFKDKDNFNLGVNDKVGPYPYDNNVDNTSDTFRKLMKDYNKRQTGNSWLIDGAPDDSWLYKIIDMNTLIGRDKRIPEPTVTTLTQDNADSLPNSAANNTRKDTALYELYKNIVERFVKKMIQEAERYAGTAHPGVGNEVLPVDNWVARTGQGPGQHGTPNGMSYCYGCKQTVDTFNDTIARWKAPPNGVYATIPDGYRGDINDNTGAIGATIDKKKWPGLYNTEINANSLDQPFYPHYWAGIDCSGFVNRLLKYAQESMNTNGSIINMNVPVQVGSGTANYTEETAMDWVGNNTFFNTDGISYSRPFNQVQQFIRRGDILNYNGDHVSTVYSDRPTSCTTNANGQTTCTYEIIHAYGGDTYKKIINGIEQRVFSRKVLVTPNDISTTISNPTGFGRIKLWD